MTCPSSEDQTESSPRLGSAGTGERDSGALESAQRQFERLRGDEAPTALLPKTGKAADRHLQLQDGGGARVSGRVRGIHGRGGGVQGVCGSGRRNAARAFAADCPESGVLTPTACSSRARLHTHASIAAVARPAAHSSPRHPVLPVAAFMSHAACDPGRAHARERRPARSGSGPTACSSSRRSPSRACRSSSGTAPTPMRSSGGTKLPRRLDLAASPPRLGRRSWRRRHGFASEKCRPRGGTPRAVGFPCSACPDLA